MSSRIAIDGWEPGGGYCFESSPWLLGSSSLEELLVAERWDDKVHLRASFDAVLESCAGDDDVVELREGTLDVYLAEPAPF